MKLKSVLSVLLVQLTLLPELVAAQESGQVIWFDKPCQSSPVPAWEAGNASSGPAVNPDWEWEHASLPVGNGSIGANVFGSVAEERLTFNEKSLWLGGPNTRKGAAYYWNVNKESAPVLKEIRQAFLDGDKEKAAQLTQDHFNSEVSYEAADEEPYRFGCFTTAGEFRIATGLDGLPVSDYARTLSLDSALVTVRFACRDVDYRREFFTSFPDNVLAMRFTASRKGMQNLTFSYLPNPVSEGQFRAGRGGELSYVASLDNNGMKYVVRIRALATGGKVKVDKRAGRIRVEQADEVVFLVTADTDYKISFHPDFTDPRTYVGVNPERTTREWMDAASGKGYDMLRSRHLADYMPLFHRCSLQLNPGYLTQGDALPTPQRLKRYRTGAPDYGLEALYFQYGRYLLIASSRPGNLPANLQGMWHNNIDGPWHMDYHNNINLQMNYWPACVTNLPECETPLFEYIRSLAVPGMRTAKAYFGARGWTASISSNPFGFTTPLRDKDMSWNFNPVAGPWLATHIWNYYDFTRDLDFLRDSYDLLKGAAQFSVDYLWRKPDGTYTAAPSTSPEHGPIDEGTTYAHAVIRELLLDAVEASRTLGVDAEERAQWEDVLAHLAPYRIGRYGQLMEWSEDIDNPTDEHRHVNHLFGLHPGHTISPVTTPDLAKAARVVLEHRGDGATGWSMGWKLNQWARLQDGNRAYTLFGNLLKNGTNENLWDSHPPFQIDGNFGGTAGVTEMLLQSHAGFIQLLPALPDVWHEGCLTGVRARGNFVLDLYWEDNNLTRAKVHSGSGVSCVVRYKGKELSFPTEEGKSYWVEWNGEQLTAEEVGTAVN